MRLRRRFRRYRREKSVEAKTTKQFGKEFPRLFGQPGSVMWPQHDWIVRRRSCMSEKCARRGLVVQVHPATPFTNRFNDFRGTGAEARKANRSTCIISTGQRALIPDITSKEQKTTENKAPGARQRSRSATQRPEPMDCISVKIQSQFSSWPKKVESKSELSSLW